MRTDPRADEVRSIVESVFSDYLRHRKQRVASRSLTAGRQRELQAGSLRFGQERFPRLYEPQFLDAMEEENDPAVPEIDETILIDRGRYVARSYRMEGYMAMWLVGVGIVQFYDARGRMLTTVNLFDSLQPLKIAA